MTENAQSVIVVSNPAAGSFNNAQYLADRTPNSNFSGVANLWFRNASGTVISGCTGSYLGGGKILTAAHCVSNGTSLTAASFTARFFQTDVGWVDVNGSGFAVKSGYSGAVIEENDVAVLTLNQLAPSFVREYTLATGNVLGLTQTLAGYGLVGTGLTGDNTSNNQFTNNAVLHRGLQTFETTCNTAAFCANQLNPNPASFGGVLLSDMDQSGVSTAGFMCTNLGFCGVGHSLFEEVAVGRGDSGGASFLSDFSITGVASWGTGQNFLGQFGSVEGHTCVALVAGNAGCTSNYNFVQSQLTAVPEPGSIVLVATGFAGMAVFARRRRKNS